MNTIRANHIQIAFLSANLDGDGPLVVCVHGFPDTAHTWNHLMPVLASAGYRVIAPFTRGYPPTQIPTDLPPEQAYAAGRLADDILALADHFSDDPVIFIGHDWGALAVYMAANKRPDRIAKMITIAIPHPRSLKPKLSAVWGGRHFIGFQFRRLAAWRLRRNAFGLVEKIYRRWSPKWQIPADESKHIKEAFGQPGAVEAALGYYWALAANISGAAGEEEREIANRKISVPTLLLFGDSDGALSANELTHTPDSFTGPYRYEILPGVGHFLHREDPETFERVVLDYLAESVE